MTSAAIILAKFSVKIPNFLTRTKKLLDLFKGILFAGRIDLSSIAEDNKYGQNKIIMILLCVFTQVECGKGPGKWVL